MQLPFSTSPRPLNRLLIIKLRNLGLDDHMLKMLENYLRDWAQTVKWNNEFSDVLNISDGVPQGSVLGPSLFICYINDIMYTKFHG